MIENEILIPDIRYIPYIKECVNNLKQWGFSYDYRNICWDVRKMQSVGRTEWSLENGEIKTTIILNQGLITLGEENIKDTIYHELGHVLAGPKAGHGEPWLKIMDFIKKKTSLPLTAQVEPEALSDLYYIVGHKYALMCEKCGKIIGFEKEEPFVKNPKEYDEINKCYRFTHKGCGGLWQRIK